MALAIETFVLIVGAYFFGPTTFKKGPKKMANSNLSPLIPTLYNAMDQVSREQTGFIRAVASDMTYDRAAVGQTVMSPVAPSATATDITPAVTPPNDGDQTIGNTTMTITKARRVPFRWNGEERLGVDNNGAQFNVILRDQFLQAMRTLTNEVEADLAANHINASRAYGTSATVPFASTLADTAQARKILADNGAPDADMQMVINTAAGANLRTLAQLTKANEAGTDDTPSAVAFFWTLTALIFVRVVRLKPLPLARAHLQLPTLPVTMKATRLSP